MVTKRQPPSLPQLGRGPGWVWGTWAPERRVEVWEWPAEKPLPVRFLRWNPCFCFRHYSLSVCVGADRHRNRKCQRDDDNDDKNKAGHFFSVPPSPLHPVSQRASSCCLQRAVGGAGSGRLGLRVLLGERRFPPELPSYLQSRRTALQRARSLPHPVLLNPPTYFLRLHTHTSTELPKFSTLHPPP